jgi:lysophospholipase L1-like esterase
MLAAQAPARKSRLRRGYFPLRAPADASWAALAVDRMAILVHNAECVRQQNRGAPEGSGYMSESPGESSSGGRFGLRRSPRGDVGAVSVASGESSSTRFGPYVVLTSLLIIALVVMNVLILAANNPNTRLGPHYYVATGDSISFGFQPNGSFFSGFADDLFAELKQEELPASNGQPTVQINLANYACPGETTSTMINGNCQFRNFIKEPYACPQICSQLDAVTIFLMQHKGNVSPVTFELGANDVVSDFNASTCTVSANGDADLATMDTNLTKLDQANPDDPNNPNNGILPRLVNALRVTPPLPGKGQVRLAGDLVLLNYYNPFAKACPGAGSEPFIHTLNDHLANDAAMFHLPVVDVHAAFGGDAGMAGNVCTYTWYCDRQDIHPTTAGYRVIAQAVENTLGYPHAVPVPAAAPPSGSAPHEAAFRRTGE